jgi:hypothetical protein
MGLNWSAANAVYDIQRVLIRAGAKPAEGALVKSKVSPGNTSANSPSKVQKKESEANTKKKSVVLSNIQDQKDT